MSLSFQYELVGRGWAECSFSVEEQRISLTASYLSDALGDLLGAVIRVVEGQSEADATFTEEPGHFRWRFLRKDTDKLRICIFGFRESLFLEPDEKGQLLFDAEVRLIAFSGSVWAESQRLLEKWDVKGYREMWHLHEFPIEKHEKLGELLRKDKKRHPN